MHGWLCLELEVDRSLSENGLVGGWGLGVGKHQWLNDR
jgi:hypothetical protein